METKPISGSLAIERPMPKYYRSYIKYSSRIPHYSAKFSTKEIKETRGILQENGESTKMKQRANKKATWVLDIKC